MVDCLPASSPPQRLLFESFFRGFGSAIPGLPALLPEVRLRWNPKTVVQRGAQALLTHRMDFLMLRPAGGRVVIEVDGIQAMRRPTAARTRSSMRGWLRVNAS